MIIVTILGLFGSVVLGGVLVTLFKKSQNEKLIKLLLAFSGGFLLSIGFIHFIPELYEHSVHNIGIFILIGFLIQLLLEFFSGGIEHGHVHLHGGNQIIPFGIIIALCIHAFFEGMPFGNQLNGEVIATSHHHDDDPSLLLGIIFHRIPVAIALMTLLIERKIAKTKAWIILLIFAAVSPLGMLFGIYAHESLAILDLDILLAIVVGMLLHISTTIIFETSENHKLNFMKLFSILFGCALAFLIH